MSKRPEQLEKLQERSKTANRNIPIDVAKLATKYNRSKKDQPNQATSGDDDLPIPINEEVVDSQVQSGQKDRERSNHQKPLSS